MIPVNARRDKKRLNAGVLAYLFIGTPAMLMKTISAAIRITSTSLICSTPDREKPFISWRQKTSEAGLHTIQDV